MKNDYRGLAVSTASDTALAHYEQALGQFQHYLGDPIATLDLALAEDPEFIQAHLFKAFALLTTSERRYLPLAREALDRCQALSRLANPRERMLVQAGECLAQGEWDEACRRFDAVLAEYPADALALQTAHLMDFYRGDALNLRNRVARALRGWNPAMPGYANVLGMLAFGLEECNQYALAERTARQALEIDPRDGWAVHAAAHAMEMEGRIAEGVAWLRAREADWALAESSFAPHLWWHLGLFQLDGGDYQAALEMVDRRLFGSQPDMILVLIDATAMLWRLRLEGVDDGGRMERVAQLWQDKLAFEPGHSAFNDFHAMLAFAATGREAAMETLHAHLQASALDAGDNGRMTREVALPLAGAMRQFCRGHYREAAAGIAGVRDIAQRFGGSHAQRDLLTLTLIEAAIRGGDAALARHYLQERIALKPTAWSARLAARIERVGRAAFA